ncbi:sulfiredoxin, chloroplastic/mitochondrial [Brachypodium distachyon]|uniref:sulfiredoxin n=1 Tax=Brachypodium distachyon TaxID=15368 RepID=I1H0K3_BRADI|nr:sulfiredoxin, chloroplastic/mitochondrial [Brachypodium distachyon]KQK19384.1 hypothetical protein BRADI_1g47970v3 [Brachypodium distachyon]|eukprot:XP_003564236.2 sulfiredoxin, chloroplastic/mitochondrial [Brachypodium distachyon]
MAAAAAGAPMASSSGLDLGKIVPPAGFRRAVPSAAALRGRSASGSRGLAFSVPSSNGAAAQSSLSDSEKKGPVVMEIPLEDIRRPLMRTRANDPSKVQELMDSIRVIGLQVPIDVLEVDGVYYGFSGCHRYEAHQRLGLPTIRCKVRRGTKETLRHHMR